MDVIDNRLENQGRRKTEEAIARNLAVMPQWWWWVVVVVLVVVVVVVVRAVYHAIVQDIYSQNLKDTLVRTDLCLSRAGFWVRGAVFPNCFSFCKASCSESEPVGSREINWTREWWRDIR